MQSRSGSETNQTRIKRLGDRQKSIMVDFTKWRIKVREESSLLQHIVPVPYCTSLTNKSGISGFRIFRVLSGPGSETFFFELNTVPNTSVTDLNPGYGAFLSPGSGSVKKQDPDPGSESGMNNPDHISESLNYLRRIRDLGSGINFSDPQLCLLQVYLNNSPFSLQFQ